MGHYLSEMPEIKRDLSTKQENEAEKVPDGYTPEEWVKFCEAWDKHLARYESKALAAAGGVNGLRAALGILSALNARPFRFTGTSEGGAVAVASETFNAAMESAVRSVTTAFGAAHALADIRRQEFEKEQAADLERKQDVVYDR